MKPIKGFEKYYSVSNYGVVYRTHKVIKGKLTPLKEPKPLKGYINVNGFNIVFLNCPDGSKHYRLHNIVWEAFNRPLQAFETIKHIDKDKLNNKLENLKLHHNLKGEMVFNKSLN